MWAALRRRIRSWAGQDPRSAQQQRPRQWVARTLLTVLVRGMLWLFAQLVIHHS